MLITESIDPVELTGLAREYFNAQDATNTFAALLPNQFINDIYGTSSAAEQGYSDAAEFRAYDAEATMAKARGAREITFKLPAISQRALISEEMLLRVQSPNATQADFDPIRRMASQIGRAIADRIEMARAEVLVSGKLTVNGENGVYVDESFGREAALQDVAPSVSWSGSTAKPLSDVLAWADTYDDHNGGQPTNLVMSRKVLYSLATNSELIKASTNTAESGVTRISPEDVQRVFAQYGFNVQTYDRKVQVKGAVRRIFPEDKVLLYPDTTVSFGATVFGTTTEARRPDYGIDPNDRPGIVVGAVQNDAPANIMLYGNAIAAPILVNPDLVMVAKTAK